VAAEPRTSGSPKAPHGLTRFWLAGCLGALLLLATASSAGAFGFLLSWGSDGTAEGQFGSPVGVATDASGNVYVADSATERIQKFDSNGQFLRMWGWGVDTGAAAFEICTSTCQVGFSGTGDGQFNSPRGIGIDAAGNVYVSDTNNDRVQKFDSNGNFITKWGTAGTGNGQLNEPDGIAPDAAGNVYVADQFNDRVQQFDANGNFISVIGSLGTGPGQFNDPDGAAVDGAGNLYIADRENDRVQKFGEAAATAKPSNVFSFGKLKRNKKKGTATLTVNVPNPGELTGSGKGAEVARAAGAVTSKAVSTGNVQLLIRAKGKKKKLNETGKVKLKVAVTYTPTGGDPNTQTRKLKLRKRV
jgi:DNA-binding beta-propeller fold protein YncE